MDRRERKLRHQEWINNEGSWFPVYKGTWKAIYRAAKKIPLPEQEVKMKVDWTDIAVGTMVGNFPYILFYILWTFILERL